MPHPLRRTVFLSPLALLLTGLVLSLLFTDAFFAQARVLIAWILATFGWLFSWSSFLFVFLVAAIYVSPLGRWTIGGKGATPLLSRWRWFAVTLCTTIATGILFWGTAEPIYHLIANPLNTAEDETRVFALSALYLHWTITPYALYTVGGVAFALAFYNYRQPFSLSAMLHPLLGDRSRHPILGDFVDALCLFALVAGMAASLGTGILTLTGGLNIFFDLPDGAFTYGLIGLAIVLAFLVSAASGLQRGIRILSNWNTLGFLLLALFFLALGPGWELLELAGASLAEYGRTYFSRSVGVGTDLPTEWRNDWTIFNWTVWFAWAPISSLFLGRLGVGYTVRQFIQTNMLWPVLFSAFWMTIFGGTALLMNQQLGGELQDLLTAQGPESVVYRMLEEYPMAGLSSAFFLVLVFMSYVTAADSNISAMSALSVSGITPTSPEAPIYVRLIWGAIIGAVAWVMISNAGIDGIRMISNLGGLPAMFLTIAVAVGLLKAMIQSFRSTEETHPNSTTKE